MDKQLKDILRDEMQAKGLTTGRIALLTGIAERHVEALLEGRTNKLPATPYVRGYIMRVAALLDLDGTALWDLYKREAVVIASGPADRLPENRFALKPVSKKWIAVLAATVAVIVYLVINADRFLGKPTIEISSPATETTVTTADVIEIFGKVGGNDKISVGGEEVIVDEAGNFSAEYRLEPGLNRIVFTAKRLLGRELTVTRNVVFQPPSPEETPVAGGD